MKYSILTMTVFSTNCVLIWCSSTLEAALLDPGGDLEKIKNLISKYGVNLTKIFLTHGHIDHVGTAKLVSSYYYVPIFGPDIRDKFLFDMLPLQSKMFDFNFCSSFLPNYWLKDGDIINLGDISFNILHCPGHTPGHVVFFNKINKYLFSGDVLFKNSIGRSDFPGSNYCNLIFSIKNKLFLLGDDIVFIPGHGNSSTLGEEKLNNPYLK
ncbi:MBL fold metallo-hydrolase [Candidatus Purcelliella pentastirinorum]|uniref:MBL fold metallo-hydrolase n=1 Tax=Candidatus Purcelliella pentastirinorum TaxID=472834 RepID=A0AAX3N7H7_9ENTR|nr:MBL fold metallo-hydrolase [Candidatus Purcelliella pentastirinorum]WDI78489.1 MBL fold metallo-hydrolase [Candidatus Purcelliella pentastirinorum]WDR80482.1 MBL fold metallo-hydrolase [Candidatus Purcelliella pentastirinorum]